jgi:hypothetical protein
MESSKLSSRWWPMLVGLCLLALATGAASGPAQTACAYAILRLETSQPVDAEAICQAAKPWAEEGVQVFVLLTDYTPQNEAEWFDFLDQAEARAGVRDLSLADSFDKNALSLAASTNNLASWGFTITYGEQLYDTPLDSNQAAGQIKAAMRQVLLEGRSPEQAFVEGLSSAYRINHPGTPVWVWLALAGGVGLAGTATVAGIARPVLKRNRRRKELIQHLAEVRERVSTLLYACDELLKGASAAETPLYQLFRAYGGENYDDLKVQVQESLRGSQQALQDAFKLRQTLVDPQIQETRGLEEQVQGWEMIYLTLAGRSDRITNLSDEELRQLFNPLLALDREAADVSLAEQLDDLERELRGKPLKLDLKLADPTQADVEGILGYVDRVKAQLADLREALLEAETSLDEAEADRVEAGKALPESFNIRDDELFAAVDARLDEVELALEARRTLAVIEGAARIRNDIERVMEFVAIVGDHSRRQIEIEAITSQGYRPPQLDGLANDFETGLGEVRRALAEGDFEEVEAQTAGLAQISQQALDRAQTWQALHQENERRLTSIKDEALRVEEALGSEAEPAWKALQKYRRENWADLAGQVDQAGHVLRRLQGETLPQIVSQNSLSEQRLREAEQQLEQGAADLALADRQIRGIANRLAEIQTAEANLEAALAVTESDLARAEGFRDREDAKISPEVDRQLAHARERLAEARQQHTDELYFAALTAQTEARSLANNAYDSASEQVREINSLQAELQTKAEQGRDSVVRSQDTVAAMAVCVKTGQTNKLARGAADALSDAQQAFARAAGLEDRALAEALGQAATAYDQAIQLADQTGQQAEADRADYEALRSKAESAIQAADQMIDETRSALRQPGVGRAGGQALKRAQELVPLPSDLESATREELQRIAQAALDAQQQAVKAKEQAERKIARLREQRQTQRPLTPAAGPDTTWSWPILLGESNWGGSSSPRSRSGSSWWRTSSGSSSSRSSSWGASRRAGSGGSSRRSSSFGSSRRSGSRGSSRRR